MSANHNLPEVYAAVVELALRLGAKDIFKLAGCWEHQIDAQWWCAVNGHAEATRSSHGASVPPFCLVVEYNGWPAGLIDPGGGVIAAGEGANEATLLEALRVAAARLSEVMS